MRALHLPVELERRLDALAKKTGRSKVSFAREALARYFEEIDDTELAATRLKNKKKRWDLADLEQKLDLEG